jgi:hypothetical protein
MRWMVLCLVLISLGSCKKEVHQDVILWGNTPPPYDGLSAVQIQSLINKFYIDLIGRGPTPDELDQFTQRWKEQDLTADALALQIGELQQTGAYFRNMDVLFWAKCLNSTDSITLLGQIALYNSLIDVALIVGDTALAYFYEPFRNDLLNLQSAALDLKSGSIGVEEYFERLIHNTIYDDVNMGSENFVLATFENLFFRKPTEYELMQGVYMVDGSSAFLFLQDGNSKRDFVEIATHSSPFYEGLVLEAYRHLLGLHPDAQEMIRGLDALGPATNYAQLQRSIITSSAYANF